MEDAPFMYTDMTERDLLKWQLDYTMPSIIADFEAIPHDKLGWRPAAKTRSAGHIFGHLISVERKHTCAFVQGISTSDVEPKFFRSLTFCDPSQDEVLQAIPSKEALIATWHDVRQQTHRYLDGITDKDLKRVPEKSILPDHDSNRQNPIREWFVMTIKHQNMGWGEIHMIRRILESGIN